jgi:L-2-hydroxycarboxylate dehydrogenase (NAD+)
MKGAQPTPEHRMSTVRLSSSEAIALATAVLRSCGLSARDSTLTSDHLVASELRGNPGHGLHRLLDIAGITAGLGRSEHNSVVAERPGFVAFDAGGRLGIPAVHDAASAASRMLDDRGSIVFSVTGYQGTTGSLGIHGSLLADSGVTSILMCNSPAIVAPFGARRAVLGTNPIAITIPGHPIQFCADLATAVWSYGAIRSAAERGDQLPVGVIQTARGIPSTDPQDLDGGSQLPLAGHKGYALGLAVELLAGPLVGAKAGRAAVPGSDGFLGILIRTDVVRDLDAVNSEAQRLFAEIKAGPTAPGASAIRIPGERSSASQKHTDQIEISSSVLALLQQLRGA